MPQMLEFELVDSVMLKENISIVVWYVEHCGEMGSAVKVVMVIMTSDSAPMGVAHWFGTGEKLCIMLLSTKIVL